MLVFQLELFSEFILSAMKSWCYPEIPIDAILRPGSEMIAAGYAMYGSFTTLVLSTGNGVNGYTFRPSKYSFNNY